MNLQIGTVVCVEMPQWCVTAVVERMEIQTPGSTFVEVSCRGHVRLFPMEDFTWDANEQIWKVKAFSGWYTGKPVAIEHFEHFLWKRNPVA